jgi:hypothetical protein
MHVDLNRDQKKITQFKNRDFIHVLSLIRRIRR